MEESLSTNTYIYTCVRKSSCRREEDTGSEVDRTGIQLVVSLRTSYFSEL